MHRDIKPANVIITNTGAVKVMDFGIARALTGASSTMTQTGMVMGTPQYLSPEQALGKPVDHRSDLYATGCMLYELLTLRPPFTGDTPLSVVYQHVQDPPVPPSQANGRVPAVLDALVLRSLAKDPDDRFQSADEMRAHIQHALRTMHQGTAMTEVLPTAAAGAADGMAATRIGDPNALTTAMGQVGNGNQLTPVMGTPQAPGGPGGPRPPVYEDRYDDDHDDRNSRRAIFAVIAVLVAIAAITIGVALAMHKTNGGTPTPTDSSTTTSSPSDTPPPTQSSTPSVTPSTTPSASTTPSDTYTPWSPSAPPSPSLTPSTTPSLTPSSTPSDTDSASSTPSDTDSSSASDPTSSTAKAAGNGPDGGN